MGLLSQLSCAPLEAGETVSPDEEIAELHPLIPAWKVVRDGKVRKLQYRFLFDREQTADRFLSKLRELAEEENHHPEIRREGKDVTVEWWTHVLGGLHPNDFIMAAKTEGLYTVAKVGAAVATTTDTNLPTLYEIPRFRHIGARRKAG